MITTKIIQSETNNMRMIKIKSLVASFFSVLFSLSILLELKKFTSLYVFIFMAIFIFLFLLYNESQKVESLRKVFIGKKSNIITSLVTFAISVCLSSVGLYFWINKTIDTTNQNNVKQRTELLDITAKYNYKIDSVNNVQLNSPIYNELKQREYVLRNTRHNNDKQLREQILNDIKDTQNKMDALVAEFNSKQHAKIDRLKSEMNDSIAIIDSSYNVQASDMNKNNFLTGIFLILVLVTEVVILMLAKEFAKDKSKYEALKKLPETQSFILYRKIISMLYATRKQNDLVSIKDIQYMPIKGLQWEMVKHLFNLMDSINIIDNTVTYPEQKDVKGKLTGSKEQALNKLDKYYNELLNFYL